MLKAIYTKEQTLTNFELFDKKLKTQLTETIDSTIGYPGGAQQCTVNYSSDLVMWYNSTKSTDGPERMWNAFGVENPYKVTNLGISVEINFPFERKGDINGVFLEDELGNIYIGHRGLVNIGGRKSVKDIYAEKFGYVVEFIDLRKKDTIILISSLNDKNLAWNIKVFVQNIKIIKDYYKDKNDYLENQNRKAVLAEFSPESIFRKPYEINKVIESICEHGRVVNSLSNLLSELGMQVVNNIHIDLYILNNKNISHVFEVKSSIDLQSIYTAIGQLFFHAQKIQGNPQKILVIPDNIKEDIYKRIEALGIQIITYKVDKNKYLFDNLNLILNSNRI